MENTESNIQRRVKDDIRKMDSKNYQIELNDERAPQRRRRSKLQPDPNSPLFDRFSLVDRTFTGPNFKATRIGPKLKGPNWFSKNFV